MGTLIAKKYPTKLFAKQADHTYVECGTGAKAWGCWGGKTDGTPFHQGAGSTSRADAIAEPNERAGITCYLINGVCHQAANRVLFPARILVTGAKGYRVSEALFGPYGRPRGFLGFCSAPFDQHPTISGDLEECKGRPEAAFELSSSIDPVEQQYIGKTLDLYGKRQADMTMDAGKQSRGAIQNKIEEFQVALFDLMMDYRIGSDFSNTKNGTMMRSIRLAAEANQFLTEQSFDQKELDTESFVKRINQQTIDFQSEVANVLNEDEYRKLFDLPRDEQVVLGDYLIAKEAYINRDQ